MSRDSRVLRDREKSLEEQFFARESEELKRRLRDEKERVATRERLREIAVIQSEETLDRMVELGITPESWAALAMVPLIEVAWANGKVEDKERRAVLSAAEANGVMPGSPAHEILDGWLKRRPTAKLLEVWGEYMVELRDHLTPAERHGLRDEVMGRARAVAEAAGGYLGLINKVSPEEEVVLQELDKAFGDEGN